MVDVSIPQIEWSLSDLPKIWREGQQRAASDRALANFAQNGGQFDPATRQLIASNPQLGISLANMMEGQRRDNRDYGLKEKEYNLRLAQSNRRETPEAVRTLEAAGIDPKSPAGHKALFPKTETPIGAADKKAIFAAEDDVPRLEGVIANITRAKELNNQVYEGFGASARGALGAKLPDWAVPDRIASPAGGKATAEWDQLMGTEAIKMMSETLKGASTDFEMRKFLSIAADTSLPAETRNNAMDRFLRDANKELDLRKSRASGLRSGDYFKPPGGAAKPDAWRTKENVTAARTNPTAALQEAKDAIAKGAPRDAVIQRLKQLGVDAAGL